MNAALAWPEALAVLSTGLGVHLCARIWAPRQLFFVDLGRELGARERARARRTQLANAALTALGTALCFGGSAAALLALMALPITQLALLGAQVRWAARAAEPRPAASRYAVPLDAPPALWRSVLWPLEAVHVCLLAAASAVFARIVPGLPQHVPLHRNWRGEWDRYGSPQELWQLGAVALALWGAMWLMIWTASRERWALAPADPARHAELELQRRATVVRMLQAGFLVANAGLLVAWLAVAYGSAPGRSHWRGLGIVAALVGGGSGTLLAVAPALGRLARLKQQIGEIAGSDVLGTRADGWRWAGLIYYAPDDAAIWVPKKLGIGATLNFARPAAWLLLGVLVLLPLLVPLGVQLFRR